MKTLNHATGRNYGKPQCLRITVLDCVADDFGLFDVSARFVDDARGISGCVSVLTTSERDIGAAVQAAYDAGDYLTA